MLAVALKPGLWPSAPRSGLWQQRSLARRPDRGGGNDPSHIAVAQRGDRRSQLVVIAVTGIHQHDPLGQTRRARCLDLLKGDLRLGLEGDLLRYLSLAPQALILRPILRKIEPISHRKAGITVGQRQGHRHLAVILLPELTALHSPGANPLYSGPPIRINIGYQYYTLR